MIAVVITGTLLSATVLATSLAAKSREHAARSDVRTDEMTVSLVAFAGNGW
jgi:hypothetical protein